MRFDNGQMLKMAGLYDCWTNPEGEQLYTYTIITCQAQTEINFIHDRMPVIFSCDGDAEMWIDCETYSVDTVLPLLKQKPDIKKEEDTTVKKEERAVKNEPETKDQKRLLEFYAVPTLVNSWKNNSADCVKPLTGSLLLLHSLML
jgi:putative SOS response-associated peptidase YedK